MTNTQDRTLVPVEQVIVDIAVMMSEFVENWPKPKKVSTALALIAKTMRAALDPSPHKFWAPGEADCPREIKAGNGELHTLRCKVCGKDNPREDRCLTSSGEAQALRHKLWMIACHATGGGIPEIEGIDRSINDICVQISAHRTAIWKQAQEAALREAARASSPTPIPVSGEVERVAEVVAEGDGIWVPCTGCQESVDGYISHNDYPYSETFRCQPGGGCGECGGLGVIWDRTDYAEMAEFMMREDRTFDEVKCICLKAGMPDHRVQQAVQAIMDLDQRTALNHTPTSDQGEHPLARMVAMDEELEEQHPGWMTGTSDQDEARAREVLAQHVKVPLQDLDFMLSGERDAVVRAMLAFASTQPALPASVEQ